MIVDDIFVFQNKNNIFINLNCKLQRDTRHGLKMRINSFFYTSTIEIPDKQNTNRLYYIIKEFYSL